MVAFIGMTRYKDCDAEIGMRSWFIRLLVFGGVFVSGVVVGVVGAWVAAWVLGPVFKIWWIWIWLLEWGSE